MYGLADFSFAVKWSPFLFLVLVAITVTYLYFCTDGRSKFRDSEPVPALKKWWFIGGMAVLYLALGSPIDLMGHYMFTFHMLSMALAYITAAPMLLAGLPSWMLRPIGRIFGIRRLGFLLHPFATLIMFNLLFSVYHFPAVHDYVMTNYVIHGLYYVILLVTAMLMWFPVICPLPEKDKLPGLMKLFYIFGNSLLLMPACALIIFSNTPMFATYTDPNLWATAMAFCIPQGATFVLETFDGPHTLQWMDPLVDQRTGGIVMKLVQETIYGGVLVYVFRQWYRKENPNPEKDRNLHEPTAAYYEKLRAQTEPAK